MEFGEIQALALWGVASWGEGEASSCLYLCLETQRGLCPLTMELNDQCVSSVCVCLCGRGCACSHTQADWPRPHLAVESAGAGSHASLKHTTMALESLFALIGWKKNQENIK